MTRAPLEGSAQAVVCASLDSGSDGVRPALALANEIGREIGQRGGTNDQNTDIEKGDSLTVTVSKIAFSTSTALL